MVLYFTGTGNSRYAAEFIAQYIGDEVVSLNNIIKNSLPAMFRSKKPFVIVAPIYAWRMPLIIEEFIKRAELIGSRQVYFIGTMASETGNCDQYCKRICQAKDMEFKGFCGVPMPSNYVISDVMPKKADVQRILKKAEPVLTELAENIKNNQKIEKKDKSSLSSVKSGIVNRMYDRFMVSSKKFVISDQCISCGKCKEVCAVNNIEIKEGKPHFGDKCINCYSCIHRCPAVAIDIKGKTENHGRYVCPDFKIECI